MKGSLDRFDKMSRKVRGWVEVSKEDDEPIIEAWYGGIHLGGSTNWFGIRGDVREKLGIVGRQFEFIFDDETNYMLVANPNFKMTARNSDGELFRISNATEFNRRVTLGLKQELIELPYYSVMTQGSSYGEHRSNEKFEHLESKRSSSTSASAGRGHPIVDLTSAERDPSRFRPLEQSLFDVVTVTMGREFYLEKVLDALIAQKVRNFRHILLLNSAGISDRILEKAKSLGSLLLHTEEPLVIGAALNRLRPFLSANYVLKLDDDAIIIGEDFTKKLEEVTYLIPDAVFSPYPVGLIGSPGGVPSKQHTAVYASASDTWYSLRKVGHVGGFARVSPKYLYDGIVFSEGDHIEDTEFSSFARSKGVPLYYLENGLIVEHCESTVGQSMRDKSYFVRTRNWFKK